MKTLDISNTQPPKKAVVSLFETLATTPSLFYTLQNLSISQIKLEEEGSRLLGVFLKKSSALTTLKMRSTSPVFLAMIAGMKGDVGPVTIATEATVGLASASTSTATTATSLAGSTSTAATPPASGTTSTATDREERDEDVEREREGLGWGPIGNSILSVLDVSRNKVTKYTQEGMVCLINLLPNVTDLNLNGTDISASSVRKMFKENIKTLDISRNYFPDDHIVHLMDHLLSLTKVFVPFAILTTCKDRNLALTHLYMNKVWGRRTKKRKEATVAVTNVVNSVSIQTFHMKGKGKSALKASLVDMMLSFVNNRVLKNLNVFGHQVGGITMASYINSCLSQVTNLQMLLSLCFNIMPLLHRCTWTTTAFHLRVLNSTNWLWKGTVASLICHSQLWT